MATPRFPPRFPIHMGIITKHPALQGLPGCLAPPRPAQLRRSRGRRAGAGACKSAGTLLAPRDLALAEHGSPGPQSACHTAAGSGQRTWRPREVRSARLPRPARWPHHHPLKTTPALWPLSGPIQLREPRAGPEAAESELSSPSPLPAAQRGGVRAAAAARGGTRGAPVPRARRAEGGAWRRLRAVHPGHSELRLPPLREPRCF